MANSAHGVSIMFAHSARITVILPIVVDCSATICLRLCGSVRCCASYLRMESAILREYSLQYCVASVV